MYDEILNELGDLATVVFRDYVYGRIKDSTGLNETLSSSQDSTSTITGKRN